ncbi:hypothetical protein ACO2Q0_06715 [Phenylobacterium sp. VNQ135]|uniref:hypothetical protein n=1 Tax=Phenylobacterium sp. VNQ135 TaxID=3400922 RepID=UPI003C00878D
MANPSEQNIQHGVPIGDGMRDSDERIATGDRREEIHFERRDDGDLKAQHLKRPEGPLPPQMATVEGQGASKGQPVQDVAVAPEGPSVWDARPRDDEAEDHPGKR